MSDQQPASPGQPARTTWASYAVYGGVLILTVVLASSLTLLVTHWLSATTVKTAGLASPASPASLITVTSVDDAASPAPGSAATTSPADSVSAPATRFNVSPPLRLLEGDKRVSSATGLDISLRPQPYRAVALQVSLQDSTGPTNVSVQSDAEVVPAVRVLAKGVSSSATVVVQPGVQGDLRIHIDGHGGHVTVDRIGTFVASSASAAGRIIALSSDQVLHLVPRSDGHSAVLDFGSSKLPEGDGAVSAVLLRVAGEVGKHGGFVKLGPGANDLDQAVYWGATTASNDLIRYGFLVVPLYRTGVHLEYHAGTELNVDLVGYVTGSSATTSTAGLSVPVPVGDGSGVRVTAAGPQNVALIPPPGLAGVSAGQVSAALIGLSALGEAPGAISLGDPRFADLAPGLNNTKRSGLALAPVNNGHVTVTSDANADVILTARVLILRG